MWNTNEYNNRAPKNKIQYHKKNNKYNNKYNMFYSKFNFSILYIYRGIGNYLVS